MEPSRNDERAAKLFTGQDSWNSRASEEDGIPSMRFSDGPHGLRIERESGIGFNASHPSTAYPTASLTACSFDRGLLRELGEHLAAECIRDNVQVLLGPGVNHKRDPRCGRNFEYFSEDPYLSGELACEYTEGVQSRGVGVSLKHFAGNSREYGRMVEDSIIDERALNELYLSQFETVIKRSRPWSVMCAYNRLNGEYCCQNEALLQKARNDWGFDGVYISDWGAVADPAESLRAGLNLEMPGGDHGSDERILAALRENRLSPEALEKNTAYLKRLADRTRPMPGASAGDEDHILFAGKAAEESAVLMKNEGALPLKKTDVIALIGPFAKTPRIQGTGSSKVNATEQDCLYDAMKDGRAVFSYAQGFSITDHTPDEELESKALDLASRCGKVIVVAGLPEGDEAEGYDRKTIALPENQNRLIRRLAEVHRNVIVVLQCGAPVELPWRTDVNAILCMYLGGCRGGEAAWNLLNGSVNPSGKLAETWPSRLEDVPSCDSFRESLLQVQYRESIFSGYRYYDRTGIEPAFPFGHGLSYTTFRYSNLIASEENGRISVSLDVTNTGTCYGKEAVQIYVAAENSRIARCVKELKGFAKPGLEPGETKTVQILLDDRSFSYYDTAQHAWMVEEGNYRILAGSSSRDIRCEASIFCPGTKTPFTWIPADYTEPDGEGKRFTEAAFGQALGTPVPPVRALKPFTGSSSVLELTESGMGKLIRKGIAFAKTRLSDKGITDDMIMESPIRMAFWLSSRVTWDTVDAIADVFNGKGTVFRVYGTLRPKKH